MPTPEPRGPPEPVAEPAQLTPELQAALAAYVATHLGLRCPPERTETLLPVLHALAVESGPADSVERIRALLDAAPAQPLLARLATPLTVGETYFLREPASFRILQEEILPEIVRRKRQAGDFRLRLWSAGCATGEEAYSLAILLDLTLPDLDRWDAAIVATDINPVFLATAERGLYRDWSLRGMPAARRERFFRHRSDGLYEPLPRLRERVAFRWLNLADGTAPLPLDGAAAFDLVLCRNVLVYFDRESAERLVRRLARAVGEDGRLLVSSVEAAMPLFDDFTAEQRQGITFYRRPPAPPSAPAEPPPEIARSRSTAPRPRPEPARFQPPDAAARARQAADRGALVEAAQWAERAVAAAKTDPATHYLLGAILLEADRRTEASVAFRRAAFLAPDFALAHYQLGALALDERRKAQALRHFDAALAILAGRDPAGPLAEVAGLAEAGLTVAGLAGMATELRRQAAGEDAP